MADSSRFSIDPSNIGPGVDPFGTPVRPESDTAHLATSKAVFLKLVEKARTFPEKVASQCVANRDYEALERTVLEHLLGV